MPAAIVEQRLSIVAIYANAVLSAHEAALESRNARSSRLWGQPFTIENILDMLEAAISCSPSGAALLFHVIEHLVPARVKHRGAINHHLPDQLFLGSKVIVQRGVVPLPSSIDNLLNRHRVNAVAGEQHLRRRLDPVLGLFRADARLPSHPT